MLIIRNGSDVEPLQYYKELAVKTRVNGERSLSFILLSTDESYSLVETDSIIEYNGQQYRIIKTNERSKGEHSVKSIQCLHILFDLIDNDVTGVLNGEQTLDQVMTFILTGTSYTFDIVDSFGTILLEDFGDDNSLSLFQKALNLFGAEFEVNNTHITLKAQIGDITDFQFRYKHNIKTIEKSIEKLGNDVKLSIKLTFAELKKAGYPYEVCSAGDTVFTIYEPMSINITNRIVEYTEYPLEPKQSTVILSNYQDNITDIMADFGSTQKRFNKVVDSNDKIKFNVLDDATQRATTALNNALTELEFPENLGIIARDPNDANRFVVLRSNGIGITTDGGRTFKEAITADGFVLSAGAIGQLSANNITIGGETSFATGYDPTTVKAYAEKVSTKGLGMRVNSNVFGASTADSGELYMHGYDSNGNPADVDGYLIVNGEKMTVSKGMLNPNATVSFGYIVYSSLSGWFLAQPTSTTHCRLFQEGKTFHGQEHQPASTWYMVGTVEMDSSENFTKATLWNDYKDHLELLRLMMAQFAESNAKEYRDLWAYPNTTYINGGNIYTNSITANEIASNIVFGNDAKFTGTVEGATIKTSRFEALEGDVIYFGDKTNPSAIIDTATDSARFQRDASNYVKVGLGQTDIYVNANARVNFLEDRHVFRFTGTTNYIRMIYNGDNDNLLLSGAANAIKFLNSTSGIQARNSTDTAYRPVMASEFVTSSRLSEKKNLENYSESALDKIVNTQVYKYHRNDDSDLELKRVGFIYEESPPEIVAPSGDGLLDYAIGAMAWKAIQELKAEVDVLKAEIESLKNGTV